MSSILSDNISRKKKLAKSSVTMKTLQLDIKKLSINLLHLHELFAATIKTSLELEHKLIISKFEIVQSCVQIFSFQSNGPGKFSGAPFLGHDKE